MRVSKIQRGIFLIAVVAAVGGIAWWAQRLPPSEPPLIPAVLDERASFHVTDLPFQEALQQLALRHGLTIAFDPDSPIAASIADVPVTMHLDNAPLRMLLELLAAQVERTIGIRNGRLFVTTPKDWAPNPNNYVARVHRLPRLLAARGDVQERELLDFVLDVLRIDGRQATTAVVQEALPGALLISAPAEQQRQVARLLDWLADQSLPESLRPPESAAASYDPADPFPVATAEIEQTLDRLVQLHFDATPFNEALAQLSHELRIPIFLDASSLRNHGLVLDAPLTLSLPSQPLHEALPKLSPRDDLPLHFHVRGGVLVLTIFGRLHERWTDRVYPMSRLIERLGSEVEYELTRAYPFPIKARGRDAPTSEFWGHDVLVTLQPWNHHQTIRRFHVALEKCAASKSPRQQLHEPGFWLLRPPEAWDDSSAWEYVVGLNPVVKLNGRLLVIGTPEAEATLQELFALVQGDRKPGFLTAPHLRVVDAVTWYKARAAHGAQAWYAAFTDETNAVTVQRTPHATRPDQWFQATPCGRWIVVRGDAESLAEIDRQFSRSRERSE